MSIVQPLVELTAAPKRSTRARVWQCALCLKKTMVYTDWCPACNGDRSLYVLEGEGQLDTGSSLIRADSYVMPERNSFPSGEWKEAYPKGIPGGTILLMRGAPGAGKTRLALRLGSLQRFCAVMSLELGLDECIETAYSCGADPSRLGITDQFRGHVHFEDVAREGANALIIDSVQKLDVKPARFFDDIRRFARGGDGGRLVIVITQSNAKGGTRGGLALEYDLAETVAMVRPSRDGIAEVTVEKNRRGKCPTFECSKVAGILPKMRRVK